MAIEGPWAAVKTIVRLSSSALAVVLLATGAAACTQAHAVSPGPGSYDTAPLHVPLRGGSGYTESIVDDAITRSGRFEVVWQLVNAGESGTITAGCSGQHQGPDVHMLVYSSGSQARDEPAVESTCSLDPGYSAALQPGQSLSFFAQFATPPVLGSRIAMRVPGSQAAIRELSFATTRFNPYGSYKYRIKETTPQWMLPVLECAASLIPADKGKGINHLADAGKLPFGLPEVIKEYASKPPPYSVAGFYDVFRQLPATPFGACLPSAAQIQQWLHAIHGALGPGTPGPPALVASGTGNLNAHSPCRKQGTRTVIVGPACFIIPQGYYQSFREPSALTAYRNSNNGGLWILTGRSYDDAFAGRNVGSPDQQLGIKFSGEPLNMNSLSGPGCSSDLINSGSQPFGPSTAEWREWTLKCPKSPPQDLQAWNVPQSRVVIVSFLTSTAASKQIEKMVAHASFIVPTAGALPSPSQISPPDGSVFSNFPRTTAVSWEPVPGAASYLVQVQACNPAGCYAGVSQPNLPPACWIASGTTYSFGFVGAQPGRWRVAALKPDGELGQFSPWREFTYTQ